MRVGERGEGEGQAVALRMCRGTVGDASARELDAEAVSGAPTRTCYLGAISSAELAISSAFVRRGGGQRSAACVSARLGRE